MRSGILFTLNILCLSETWNESLAVKFLADCSYEYIQAPALRLHIYGRARGGLIIAFKQNRYSVISILSDQIIVKVTSILKRIEFVLGLVYCTDIY